MREHPAPPEYQPVVRALCAELHDLGGISASVAIAVDDRVVFSTAAGPRCLGRPEPLHPTTTLGIGSITKLVSTVLALEVAEREGLTLDAPLHAALPEFSDAPSLRELLTHTAGLRDPEPMAMLERGEQWPALLAERRASPGSHVYANANFLLVGRWLEHATGRPFAELYATDPALAPVREHVSLTLDPSIPRSLDGAVMRTHEVQVLDRVRSGRGPAAARLDDRRRRWRGLGDGPCSPALRPRA